MRFVINCSLIYQSDVFTVAVSSHKNRNKTAINLNYLLTLKAVRRKLIALPTHLVAASVNLRKATATSNTLHRPFVIWFTKLHAPSHRLATAGNRKQRFFLQIRQGCRTPLPWRIWVRGPRNSLQIKQNSQSWRSGSALLCSFIVFFFLNNS